jgi:hypothetical protein
MIIFLIFRLPSQDGLHSMPVPVSRNTIHAGRSVGQGQKANSAVAASIITG